MLIRHFFTPGLAINTYLVFDEEDKLGAIIDPTRDVDTYIQRAAQEGVTITDIFETHVHADFASGSLDLKKALHDVPKIHCSGMGGKEWIPTYADHIVHDRDEIHVGSLRFQAWHTPGHTPEHMMWVVFNENRSLSAPQVAFTGDLLFVGSVGRPDLLGPESEAVLAKQLYLSLFKTIHPLPDFVEVYPAHGSGSLCGKAIATKLSSTFGYEKRSNPGLIPQPYDSWHKQLNSHMPPAPRYFSRMKQYNITGPKKEAKGNVSLLSKAELVPLLQIKTIVDVRRPDKFSEAHFKGAINIPFSPSFATWAGIALPNDQDIIIVLDAPQTLPQIVQLLKLIGVDNIVGYVNLNDWSEGDLKAYTEASPMIDIETLKSRIDDYQIVDVRNDAEWEAGHIPGALHLELPKAAMMLDTIPTTKPIAVICHSGNRASIIASLLIREGRKNVFNVKPKLGS